VSVINCSRRQITPVLDVNHQLTMVYSSLRIWFSGSTRQELCICYNRRSLVHMFTATASACFW